MATKPLNGVRVLDLTNVLAGPYCCYQLAMMGADVIKVERPGSGDLARVLGADPERNKAGMGISFLAQNAGKRSVTLDMKSMRGKELLKELVKTADVLVENFRPQWRWRLGQPRAQDACTHRGVTGPGEEGEIGHGAEFDRHAPLYVLILFFLFCSFWSRKFPRSDSEYFLQDETQRCGVNSATTCS